MCMIISGLLEQRGEIETALDQKPFTIFSYANGPSWFSHRNFSARTDMNNLTEAQKPSWGQEVLNHARV